MPIATSLHGKKYLENEFYKVSKQTVNYTSAS